jgi:hypothetical protein
MSVLVFIKQQQTGLTHKFFKSIITLQTLRWV